MPFQKLCEVCGKEFTAANARAETAKTCSQACRGVLIAASYQQERARFECLKCSKPIFVSASRAERGPRYCSMDCRREHSKPKLGAVVATDGATRLSGEGYVYEYARSHPFASRGRVFQHRLVIEALMRVSAPDHHFLVEMSGQKYLRPNIDVHHKNEVKTDNRPTNLVACTKAAHKDMHRGDTPMAGEIWPETGDLLQTEPRLVIRSCAECAREFTTKRSAVLAGGGKFCSIACRKAKESESGLPPQVSMKCGVCSTDFTAPRYRVLMGRGRYCSDPCRIKFLATTHSKGN
jgi:hypothetical protein